MDEVSAQKIKEFLGTKTLKKSGYVASGCINNGEGYYTDSGHVFIKRNNSSYVSFFAVVIYLISHNTNVHHCVSFAGQTDVRF